MAFWHGVEGGFGRVGMRGWAEGRQTWRVMEAWFEDDSFAPVTCGG
jgi:hypothetical protein